MAVARVSTHEVESNTITTGGSLTSASLTVATGEVLVFWFVGGTEFLTAAAAPSKASGTATLGAVTSRYTQTGLTNSTPIYGWSTTVTAGGTLTVTVPYTYSGSATAAWMVIDRYTGATEPGTGSGTTTVTATTGTTGLTFNRSQAADSVLSWVLGDWNAVGGIGTATTGNTVTQSILASTLLTGWAGVRLPDTAGTKTIGISSYSTSAARRLLLGSVELPAAPTPLAEHSSTPAVVRRAYGTGTAATTASFTPPVDALLAVMVVVGWGSNPSGTPTLTITDSQSGTWTAGPTSLGGATQVAIFTRRVVTSAAMTITATSSSATGKSMMLTARVLTGTATSQAGAATLNVTTSMTGSITTTTVGSGVLLAGGYGTNDAITPTAATTSLDAWADTTSGDDLAVGRMTNLTTTPGAVSLGWSPAGRVVGLEILPSAAGTNYSQTVTDGAGAADTPTSASTAAQTALDQALAADTAARNASYAPTVVDTAGAADAQTSIRELNANPVDSAGAADTSEPTVDYQRFWVEPAGVADSAIRSSESARNAVDAVGATDITEQTQDVAATVTDSVDVADEVEFNSGELLDVEEALGVDDTVEAESEYAPALADAAGAADLVALEAGFAQEFVETVAVADAADALVDHRNDITETVGAVDQIAVVVHSTPVITDAIGAADTFTQGVPASRQVVDTARAVDSVDVNTVGRVTTPADGAMATDAAVVLTLSVSMSVPVAIEATTALEDQRAAQANVPEAAETDTVEVPRPTGSYPTEQAGDWELTFTPIVLVDDGEFAVAINDEDRTPTYVLKADWNRNGLYDHPLSDLTDLVEEVTVSRALSGTLPVEVGLVEGYSTAELAVRLVGEIPADAFEALDDRRNLIVNPSFETGTAGWSSNGIHSGGNMPREQAPFPPPSGGWYAYSQRSSVGDFTIYPTALSTVTPGQRYTGSIYVNRDGSNDVRLDLDWYNSAGTFIVSTFGALNNPPTGTWTRLVTSGVAPAGATRARIFVRFIDQAVNFYVRLDAALLEQSTSTVVGPYFDGSKAGAVWEGTAHNSTSLLLGAQQPARVSGREFDVVDAFAPYRPDSPLYGRPVLQTPIYLEVGFLADDGPRLTRRFTGTVTQIHPESASRFVELRAVDPVNRLRSSLTLSGVALFDSIMARRGPDQYRSRINSQWLIDYALRRNGIYASPPARTDAVLSVTGHGSMIPEVGWGGAPEEYYPTYRGATWFPGRFGPLCTIGSGPIGRWWLSDEVNAASGTGWGFSQWMALYPAGTAAGQYFSVDLTFDQSWFINFGVDTSGRPYVGATQTGSAEVRATPSGYTPPAVGTWAFVGCHITFAATSMTVRFRINQTTYTSTVNIAARGSNWRPGVYMRYSWIATFSNFQLWKGATVPTAPWQGEDPNWIPQAELDPGMNELTGIPPLLGVDSWDLIRSVTDAEGSTFDFDEYGKPRFRTAKGDAYYGRTKTVKETVSADRNLADLVSTTDESTIRNIINIKTKMQLISDWQDYFTATTVDQFDTPPGTSVFDIPIGPEVYEIPQTRDAFGTNMGLGSLDRASFVFYISEGPWNDSEKVAAIRDHIRVGIVYAANPVEITDPINNVPAIYIRVARPSPTLMRIYITNYSTGTVRFATPSVAQDGVLRDGSPALTIPAQIVEPKAEQIETYTDNTSVAVYGPSSFDVGGSEETWRQIPAGLRSLATEVLTTTASPVPVLDAVDVPHDPRRKLGDRIVLRDPDGLGEVTVTIVGLSQTFSSTGTRDQITVRPIAPPGTPT